MTGLSSSFHFVSFRYIRLHSTAILLAGSPPFFYYCGWILICARTSTSPHQMRVTVPGVWFGSGTQGCYTRKTDRLELFCQTHSKFAVLQLFAFLIALTSRKRKWVTEREIWSGPAAVVVVDYGIIGGGDNSRKTAWWKRKENRSQLFLVETCALNKISLKRDKLFFNLSATEMDNHFASSHCASLMSWTFLF